MGYTEQDAMEDLRDQHIAAGLIQAGELWRETFGEKAGAYMQKQQDPVARLAYPMWLAKHLNEAEDLNKSAPRVVICMALAGMPNYEVNDDRDAALGLPVGIDMLEEIMPPATDDAWGSYGRPTSFFHQVLRMGGPVRSGKKKGAPMNLIEILYHPRVGNQPGQLVRGYKLDSTGMCYAHLHAKGKITKDDTFDYWLHVTHGFEMPEATNPAYRALIGVGPVVDDSPNQWQTPGTYAWKGSLAHLENDSTVAERYKAVSAHKLSKALIAVHTKDAVECLKFLDKDDQRLLFNDVMKRSKVGDSKYARSKIMQDLDAARTYAAKIEVLVTLYGSEHGPQATTSVIEELVCRCAWAVVTRVMGYRTGQSFGHVVDAAEELMNHARTLEQLETLQQMVGDLSATLTDEPEIDEDSLYPRNQTR